MFVPAAPPLRLRFRRDRRARPAAPLPGRARLYARGRFALFEGFRLLARERGLRRVWMPAWICGPVPAAARAAGIDVRFHDLDHALVPRLDTIEPDRGDGLLVVHYFGLAQPLGRLRAYCDAHGLSLIEDCAHALPGVEGPARIGTVGDIAVFSPGKPLPVPGGGLLLVNDPRLREALAPPPPLVRGGACELAKLAVLFVQGLAATAGVNILRAKSWLSAVGGTARRRTMSAEDEYRTPPAPSRLVLAMLRAIDRTPLARERCRDYAALAAQLRRVAGVAVAIPEAPAGSVPLALPVWAPDAAGLAEALRGRGVDATCWPWGERLTFPRTRYPGATAWLTRSVCLPLAMPLSERSHHRVARAVAVAASVVAGNAGVLA